MPSCARKTVVDQDEVGVYHVWGRCVRRAWLCGDDPVSGNNYDYRRDWICKNEEAFAALFAIDIGFHVEMCNHLHLVLRTRPDVVAGWSDEEVVRRVLTINNRTRNLAGELELPAENEILVALNDRESVAEYRLRLSSPSWFMKALRENIARRSNQEDSCSGVFWDGRFKCRRLLDETAILICGIYVDLNQIRAGETQSPEESTHTSAFDRIAGRDARQAAAAVALSDDEREQRAPDGWLGELTLDERQAADPNASLHSRTGRRASDKGLIPVSLDRYLELLDWTGRAIRSDKAGAIPEHLAPILERLQIRSDRWIDLVTNFDRWFGSFAGHVDRLATFAAGIGRKLFRGLNPLSSAFMHSTSGP